MEVIDVINPDGTPAGMRKPKEHIHRDGDWHRTAHVWIVTGDGRVLLQKRSSAKDNYPGYWDVSAAGHVSAGETPREAAVREVAEELSLEIKPEELTAIGEVCESAVLNGGTYVDNELHTVFVLRRELDAGVIVFDRVEVEAVALVSLADLRARIEGRDPTLVPHHEEYRLLFAWLAA